MHHSKIASLETNIHRKGDVAYYLVCAFLYTKATIDEAPKIRFLAYIEYRLICYHEYRCICNQLFSDFKGLVKLFVVQIEFSKKCQ